MPDDAPARETTPELPATAPAVAAQLRAAPGSTLTASERALLQEWLGRLAVAAD